MSCIQQEPCARDEHLKHSRVTPTTQADPGLAGQSHAFYTLSTKAIPMPQANHQNAVPQANHQNAVPQANRQNAAREECLPTY